MVLNSLLLILSIFITVFSYDNAYFLKTESSSHLYTLKLSNPEQSEDQIIDLTQAQPIKLKTNSGIAFDALFFDRHSTVALVLGQGFPASKESMTCFAKLFQDYDIIVFDYRWSNICSYLLRPSSIFQPVKSLVLNEIEEVVSVINFLKSYKNYSQIIGLGECYSNFLFVAAQVREQKENSILFDKLILDSCWLSLKSFTKSISIDPLLPLYPQTGGCPNFIKSLLSSRFINKPLLYLISFFIPRLTIKNYLSKLHSTPILFIHGINDKMVPVEHFNRIWSYAKSTPKVALLTPYGHSENLYDKYIYKQVCDNFISSSNISEFTCKLIG